jgi:hypothetical protein
VLILFAVKPQLYGENRAGELLGYKKERGISIEMIDNEVSLLRQLR